MHKQKILGRKRIGAIQVIRSKQIRFWLDGRVYAVVRAKTVS